MDIITKEQTEQLTSLAEILIKSNALPKWFDNPQKVFMILMAWRDLWLNPTQAINGLYIVNGKITVFWETAVLLIKKAGYDIEIIESTSKQATVKISKWGKSQECTYTMAEADHAWISQGGMWIWKRYPKTMLMYKALAFARKFFCPDALWGYSMKEELDGEVVDLKEELTEEEKKQALDGFSS